MNLQAKLRELDLALPPVPKAVAEYVPAVQSGRHIFVSGQLPLKEGELLAEGQVPEKVDLETARRAARQAVLNGLAAVDGVLDGDWSKFVRVVRLAVFVNCDHEFNLQHKVADGASELLTQVFGDAGRHVRAAVGAAGLPLGASVEVELVLEIH